VGERASEAAQMGTTSRRATHIDVMQRSGARAS
jgi:hypothetical protein